MKLRQIVQTGTIGLTLCGVLGGCSQLYNGAFSGVYNRDRQQAYEEFKRQQQMSAAQHNQPTAGSSPLTASAPDPYQQQSPHPSHHDRRQRGRPKNVQFETPDPMAGSSVQLASRNASIGTLGLYGQLPGIGSSRSMHSSPLDSPDNLRQVTFATEGADFDPDVDPTGTLLVYASTQHRATADLYLKRIQGTALQQLTNDSGNDVMPTFSPDGKRVAFASDRSGNWDIYMMDVTGGQAIQLTNDLTHDLSPSFSPDGKQLVYCTLGTQSGQWELVVIDIDNPAIKRFIGFGLFPDWSPVDHRILFQRARERGTRWFSVWTVEMVNGEGVRPTEIAASSNAAGISPSWSPDGQHITFSTVIDPDSETQAPPAQADIWILNADGSGRANLTNSQFANLHPVWAADGSIFFVSNRAKNGIENIWAIRPDRALRVAQPMGAPTTQPSAMAPIPGMQDKLNTLIANEDAMVPTQ